MTNFGHVSWRHGVGGENWATQAGGPQIIRAQRLLLGLAMRGECPRLFCNDTNRVRMTKNNWAETNVTSSLRRFPSVPCLCKAQLTSLILLLVSCFPTMVSKIFLTSLTKHMLLLMMQAVRMKKKNTFIGLFLHLGI